MQFDYEIIDLRDQKFEQLYSGVDTDACSF